MTKNANENGEGGAIMKNSGSVPGGSKGGFTQHDLIELQKFSKLVVSRKIELSSTEEGVEQMSSFGHWWDAKVLDSDRGLLNFVSLTTCTNKSVINDKIKKYKNFYSELKTAVDELRAGEQNENVDADEILMLYDTLSGMIKEAESGKETSNSSTLYKIHSEFISKQEPLENMIKRVECVALRQQLKHVTKAWKQALGEITDLKREVQEVRADNKEMKKQLDSITAVNAEMANYQQDLMQRNQRISDMLEELLEKQRQNT